MRDCTNARMKDLLPDLLHDRLTEPVRSDLRAHVAACEHCRSELDLLARARAAAVTPSVDIARVVGALPSFRGAAHDSAASTSSLWKRATRSRYVRIAAGVILVAGFGAIGSDAFQRSSRTQDTTGSFTAKAASGPPELAVGEALADLPESDLRALLEELGQIEPLTPAETEVIVVPSVRGGA